MTSEPRTRTSDGSLIVSSEVADVLFALANDLVAETEKVLEQCRNREGDYLAAVESLADEHAAQMRVLAHGMWGAGTAVPDAPVYVNSRDRRSSDLGPRDQWGNLL